MQNQTHNDNSENANDTMSKQFEISHPIINTTLENESIRYDEANGDHGRTTMTKKGKKKKKKKAGDISGIGNNTSNIVGVT